MAKEIWPIDSKQLRAIANSMDILNSGNTGVSLDGSLDVYLHGKKAGEIRLAFDDEQESWTFYPDQTEG